MGFITKFDYIQYKRCPRLFACNWFASSETKNVPNPVKDFLTQQGQEVGLLAQQLFLGTDGIAFEKPVSLENLYTRPDVLNLVSHELIEIKSTTEIKEQQLIDVAFQKYVCDKAQVQIDVIKIGHVDKNYKRQGDIDVSELFQIADVTKEVLPVLPQIKNDLAKMEEIIREQKNPQASIGPHCFADDGCPFKNECLGEHINDSIFNLRRDVKGKRFELFGSGIHSIKDIPDFVELTKFQAIQKEAEENNCAVINHAAIAEHFHEIVYPLFYLDFESFLKAIPVFSGTKPFQQIPFQASIHKEKKKGHKLKHYSFLHTEDSDPRLKLAEFLVSTLEEYGTIVVYHASFEKGRIYELISEAPHLEKELLALIDRIWDLETIFEKGFFVHPEFKGSSSIKKVLPVLCPELTYENLDINNGQLAFVQYLKMISPAIPKEEKEKIKNDLETYCAQDTYAMYAILKKISELL